MRLQGQDKNSNHLQFIPAISSRIVVAVWAQIVAPVLELGKPEGIFVCTSGGCVCVPCLSRLLGKETSFPHCHPGEEEEFDIIRATHTQPESSTPWHDKI